jgi:hypothetical protein
LAQRSAIAPAPYESVEAHGAIQHGDEKPGSNHAN